MVTKSRKRSINFSESMLQTLDKLAVKKNTTTSELVRSYVEKGLSVEGNKEDVDFIASILRQELNAVYQLEDIRKLMEQQVSRIAKMLMKVGKVNAGGFYLLLKVLMNLAEDGSEDRFDVMLQEAISLGVEYMQKKGFQINAFLQDTNHLRNMAEKL